MTAVNAVLFDKDGTLIDFHRTWDAAVGFALRAAAPGKRSLARAAEAIAFDLAGDTVMAGSPLIAEPNSVVLGLLEPYLDTAVFARAALEAATDAVVAAPGLPELLHALRADGVRLAVVTNDWQEVTRDQLAALGWADLFDVVLASDSGFGAKPDPAMVTGALDRLDVHPAAAVMVGDAMHDVAAGHAAGVRTVLVTNGLPPDPEAAALADVVVETLSGLDLT